MAEATITPLRAYSSYVFGSDSEEISPSDTAGFSKRSGRYYPAVPIMPLPPGYYSIGNDETGDTFLLPEELSEELLFDLYDSPVSNVVKEIEEFWKLKDKFLAIGLAYKRGFLLYGPPGTGKSSCMKLVARNVIETGGIILRATYPFLTRRAIQYVRKNQPETKILVIFEDLDQYLEDHPESSVLNLLDGVDHIDGVVFLGSTNYIEDLESRISNRPSRFDRKILIDHPSDKVRQDFLFKLFQRTNLENKDGFLDKIIHDTKGLSIAHIKELFILLAIYNEPYESALEELKKLKKNQKSEHEAGLGFRSK